MSLVLFIYRIISTELINSSAFVMAKLTTSNIKEKNIKFALSLIIVKNRSGLPFSINNIILYFGYFYTHNYSLFYILLNSTLYYLAASKFTFTFPLCLFTRSWFRALLFFQLKWLPRTPREQICHISLLSLPLLPMTIVFDWPYCSVAHLRLHMYGYILHVLCIIFRFRRWPTSAFI